jgi:hypothetical protein
MEMDIYIPEFNIGIELCGLYWHSSEYKDKNYHKNKYKIAKEKNIRLIQIFEDEWIYKKDIVLSTLKNILQLNIDKVFARKCIIDEINYEEAKTFLNNHHYIGTSMSTLYIGLRDSNQTLVAVMAFKKTKEIWELTRYVTSINVVGGASKLLNYFENNYKPKAIKTFADLRWSNGDLYRKIGFIDHSVLNPDYMYIINNIREHKFKHRKKYYKNRYNVSLLTEQQIMKKENILRIYDAGKIKFIKLI